MMEWAAVGAVVVFAVFVGFLVPILVKLQQTLTETSALLKALREEAVPLVSDVRVMTEELKGVAQEARAAVDQARVFLGVVGELGEVMQQAQHTIREQGERARGIWSGVLAAAAVVLQRVRQAVPWRRGDEREYAYEHGGAFNGE